MKFKKRQKKPTVYISNGIQKEEEEEEEEGYFGYTNVFQVKEEGYKFEFTLKLVHFRVSISEWGREDFSFKGMENSRKDGEDIISSLPDTILHLILSFLDMKHAVQTSILSTRWRNVWTSLGSLSFNSELFHSPKTDRCDGFLDFVDQVLLLRDSSNIQMFHLMNFFGTCVIKHRLNTWIISVIRRNVRKLYIDVWSDGIRLPNGLFTCNSLTNLMLAMNGSTRWSINLPDSMSLPNLLILEINSVTFNDERLTNKFFLSFPNLEALVLIDVEFICMNVNISCLKLNELVVQNLDPDYDYCGWPGSKFKLNTPGLLYFNCEDYMSKEYILENVPSLFKADIDMKVEEVEDQNPGLYSKFHTKWKPVYAKRMMQCLRALVTVKDLKLSECFLEVISGSSGFLESQPTKLCYLRCLSLETWLSWNTIRSITYLLNISPNLKSLFLKISKCDSENKGNYPETEVSLQCLLDKLGCVEIRGAVGCVNELKFLEILLKNAKVLKKLVVYTSTEQLPDRQKRFTKFTEKLLTFPKASSDITILVC